MRFEDEYCIRERGGDIELVDGGYAYPPEVEAEEVCAEAGGCRGEVEGAG